MTTTLHIAHDVTDFAAWKRGFDHYAKMRKEIGVRQERTYHPVDDSRHVVLQLDFDEVTAAEKYLDLLRTQIWSEPGNVPTLVGEPQARILILAEAAEGSS